MTSDEFRSALKSLGLRQNALAERLGIDTVLREASHRALIEHEAAA